MIHSELVDRAVWWLRGTRRCPVVMRECGATCGNEIPDAIGWTSRGVSIVVECKSSVQDCYADRLKPCERSGSRCGEFRYVMTDCPGITLDRLIPGWGLLRVGARIRRERESDMFQRSHLSEIRLLVAEMRRCVRPGKPGGNGLIDPSALFDDEEEKDRE